MAYIPDSPHAVIRDKSTIRYTYNGADGDEITFGHLTDDLADMTLTLRDDAIVTDPSLKSLTSQTVAGEFHFSGNVYFDGSSSADNNALALAIALG